MSNLILTTPDELRAIVAEEVAKVFEALANRSSPEPAPPLMTRKSVAAYLQVSVSTVDNYARQGVLTKVPFGDRGVRFERVEVERVFELLTLKG